MPMIPFNKPYLSGLEFTYMKEALDNSHISGDGEFTKKCHRFLEAELGIPKALLTTSCTHALEIAALLLRIQPGDEVIVPSFTFVSTVNAFVLRGAKPIFADVRPDTLNLDEKKLPSLISKKTKAIVPVHYAGIACEMDAIMTLAKAHGIAVVEDNAHGLFGKYKGRWLGTIGDIGTLSFHETKNFSCGEGGALLLNEAEFIPRAEIIREKGTNRSRFFRGEVDKYSWVDVGSSYLPSDILAAFLYAQLLQKERIQSHRRELWSDYYTGLKEWAEANQVQLPLVPKECDPAYHMFHIVMPSATARERVIKFLKERDIHSVFHYLPLHLSTMGVSFGGKSGDCPVTESVSDRLVRLPFYNTMTKEERQRVIAALKSFI